MNVDLNEIRKLPVADRLQLVEDLWDSIAADTPDAVQLTPEQQEELQHRRAEHAADPGSAIPWAQVRAEMWARTKVSS
jgi:putative addiction module component (TIGR02574 family)